jgi:ankyrin repeat protein
VALVRFLCKELGADVNQAGNDGGTPLIVAIQIGHMAVALCLVKELGADVNKAMDFGSSPLYKAAAKKNLNLIRCLAEFGADINQATNDVNTPLFIAAFNGHLAAVQYLANLLGADVDRANISDGARPFTSRRRMSTQT